MQWVTSTRLRTATQTNFQGPDPEGDLFRAIYPAIRRFAAVVAPGEVEPDDLVQDVLEHTLRIAALTDLEDPAAYLCRAVLNRAKNERRSLARRRRAVERLGRDQETYAIYPSDLSDLLTLTPRERVVLFLHDVEGYSYGELAMILGVTEAAVRKLSSRARKRMRIHLVGR